ncbi:MAG: HIT family protein [Patescibacteria group bacterium]|nr:HIT family protein [Patescibacteria group bacterium]
MDCFFCKIANKEVQTAVIYEDEKTMAFLDIHPSAPGHAVVIPKFHAVTILDLPDAELEPLFSTVKKMAALLKGALAPDGITIGMNQGRASGQEVDHLHVHLIPRWHEDGGRAIQSVVNNKSGESVEEVKNKILEAQKNK